MTDVSVVYAHAPVVEAVIDLQVQLGDDADGCLSRLSAELASEFPERGELHLLEMQMRPDGTSVNRNAVGWRMTSAKGDRVLQLKRQGFTYSHMSPYTQWSVFRGEAQTLWSKFAVACAPKVVTRTAVRYINRLKLPPGAVKLEDYLAVYPQLPAAYEPVHGLLMQLQQRHESIDPSCSSVVTIASEPASESEFQPMLLDIDVFVEKAIAADPGDFWQVLEKLRLKKNELFEAAVTDKLRGTFK